MNVIRNFGIVICIITIACSIIEFIYPNGNMEKIVKFVMSAFIIYTLVFSISNMAKISIYDFLSTDKNKISKEQDNQFINKISEQTNDNMTRNLLPIIKKHLDSINVTAKKINVIMDTEDKSSISIIKVLIYLDKDNIKFEEEVKKMINENIGLTSEVIEC